LRLNQTQWMILILVHIYQIQPSGKVNV